MNLRRIEGDGVVICVVIEASRCIGLNFLKFYSASSIAATDFRNETGDIHMYDSINVFNEPLQICGEDPMTGFYRDGQCNTCKDDHGSHTVCTKVSQQFLEYSRFCGNDLSTPRPEFGFSGLRAGDTWCLCASRWLEASEKGMAPPVYLRRTHIKALEIIPLQLLKQHALDGN